VVAEESSELRSTTTTTGGPLVASQIILGLQLPGAVSLAGFCLAAVALKSEEAWPVGHDARRYSWTHAVLNGPTRNTAIFARTEHGRTQCLKIRWEIC
jgi:hypothetical protein